MILATKRQDLLDDLRCCLIGRVLWERFGVRKTGFAMLLGGIPPFIGARSANPEVSAGFANIVDLLGMLKYSKLALNVTFVVRHENFFHPKSGKIQEVSREAIHVYI